MNKAKASASAARTKAKAKPVKKRSTVSSAKSVKKRSSAVKVKAVVSRSLRSLSPEELAVKFAATTTEPKRTVVPLAEIEALAAKAVKRIKAARKLSAADKAWRLEDVARSLKNARGWGGLSKCGASGLAHIHEPVMPYDMRAVMR